MSVLNFLLKNLQGCCLLFNYQGSFSLLSSQRQLIYIITFTIACQQLFYFSFSLSASIIFVVRNSLSRISFLSTFVNRKFHLFFCLKMSTLKSTFFRVFIVLPFCTIRSLFYCIFSLLGSAVVRLPLLPASHAPCIRCYASCFTSSLNNSPAEW